MCLIQLTGLIKDESCSSHLVRDACVNARERCAKLEKLCQFPKPSSMKSLSDWILQGNRINGIHIYKYIHRGRDVLIQVFIHKIYCWTVKIGSCVTIMVQKSLGKFVYSTFTELQPMCIRKVKKGMIRHSLCYCKEFYICNTIT